MTTKYTPFYTIGNGAIKCRETQDGYSITVNYGHTSITTYFTGLDSMAEYIYFTAADENETEESIMKNLEVSLKDFRRKIR